MSERLPAFGPSQVFEVEGVAADLVIRVAAAVSREQLLAAVALAFTNMPETDPATLTPEQIRTEVESELAVQMLADVDRTLADGWAVRFEQEHLARYRQFTTALENAYPPPPILPPLPGPQYVEGQVMLVTHDAGALLVDEPVWCIGHAWQPNPHRVDITHNATRVKAGPLTARISWAPFIEEAPRVAVELDVAADYEAEEIPALVGELRTAIGRLERLAAEAIRLRGQS
ncbi:DUF6907 domain-containing protein [Streptomyces sp. NPDC102467]|uniref:DUF6907 domain-containing protein n=1 Tax=Streptomyces sp. NPDC102467 TaxID=3366179 RepID=UPI00380C131D